MSTYVQCACMWAYTWAKDQCQVSLIYCSPCFLRHDLLTETILTRLAGKQALEILLPLYPSRVGIKRCCLLCPVVYMNAGDPNPGPYTSTETALPTLPFPQPLWNLFPKLNLPSNCQKGAPPTSLCMLVQKYNLYISNRSFLIVTPKSPKHHELGTAVHAVIQAMGQENRHLAHDMVNISQSRLHCETPQKTNKTVKSKEH